MYTKPEFTEKRFVYGPVFRVLHWAVALSFIILVTLVFSRNLIDDPVLDKQILGYHRSFGMLALCLLGLRLAWRLYTREMPYTGNNPMIQAVASVSHAVIYLLLLVTPLFGWMEASARHKPVTIFGLDLPMLIGRNLELAEELQVWHTHFGTWFCVIVTLHVSSAIWHHVVRRDGVLYAMLPIKWLRKPRPARPDFAGQNRQDGNDQ
jgi:cytochrome b561